MKKKKLVIVSHVFPPSLSANAKRPYLMAKYLVAKAGWDVVVFTSSLLTQGRPIQDIDGIKVVHVKSPLIEMLEWAGRSKALRKRLEQLLLFTIPPDFFLPWMNKVARRVRREDYDCGILNVRPYSAFEFVRQGVLDSRWVIDYQESVYPFLEEHPRASPIQRLFTPRLFQLERKALNACGGVWFTSSANRNRYIADGVVEERKTAYSPYFYDPEMYPRQNQVPDDAGQMTILYGGHLDGDWRNPEPFFQAWLEFLRQEPEANGKIRLNLYGRMSDRVFEMARRQGIANWIDVREQIPYRDFLKQATCSDALLYLDAAGQRYFNPGKLADYFGANKPVLGYTTKGSEVEDMLETSGMGVFTADIGDVGSGVAALAACWKNWKFKSAPRFTTDFFSVDSVCGRANHFLEQMLSEKRVVTESCLP